MCKLYECVHIMYVHAADSYDRCTLARARVNQENPSRTTSHLGIKTAAYEFWSNYSITTGSYVLLSIGIIYMIDINHGSHPHIPLYMRCTYVCCVCMLRYDVGKAIWSSRWSVDTRIHLHHDSGEMRTVVYTFLNWVFFCWWWYA